MSTEVLETTLECYKEDLVEFINDSVFDMLDEFTDEEIADAVISIANRLMYRDFCNGHMIKFGRPNKDYLYSINNEHKGFVSISDDCSTGVSRTEYYPFYKDDEEGWYTGLCSLAEMINDAWYLCNN